MVGGGGSAAALGSSRQAPRASVPASRRNKVGRFTVRDMSWGGAGLAQLPGGLGTRVVGTGSDVVEEHAAQGAARVDQVHQGQRTLGVRQLRHRRNLAGARDDGLFELGGTGGRGPQVLAEPAGL